MKNELRLFYHLSSLFIFKSDHNLSIYLVPCNEIDMHDVSENPCHQKLMTQLALLPHAIIHTLSHFTNDFEPTAILCIFSAASLTPWDSSGCNIHLQVMYTCIYVSFIQSHIQGTCPSQSAWINSPCLCWTFSTCIANLRCHHKSCWWIIWAGF